MNREYTEVKASSWTRGFLSQFRDLYVAGSKGLYRDVILKVKGFQQVKRGIIAYMIFIPRDLADWANSLGDVFNLFCLIENFDKNSGKSYSRLVSLKFAKYKIKGEHLICYPIQILMAKNYRRLERTRNVTEKVYANNFTLPIGKVDVITNRAFIRSVFRNAYSMLSGHFTYVSVGFFDENKLNIIKLVEKKLQPFWIEDLWVYGKDGLVNKKTVTRSRKDPHEKDEYPVWEWGNESFVFLKINDLLHFESEKEYEEDLDRIMRDVEMKDPAKESQSAFRRKFRGETAYPVLCAQGDDTVLVGYVHVLTKEPLRQKELALIEDQLQWLGTTIISGVHTRINVRSQILNFSAEGASFYIGEPELVDYLKKISFFKFKMFFDLDSESTFVEIGAKILYKNIDKQGKLNLGVKFRSFDPYVNPKGEFVDGRTNYMNALKNYRIRYSLRSK